MYTLREFLLDVVGLPDEAVPSDEIYCSETDIERTNLTNRMQDSLAAYSYTLVRRGWLSIAYGGREITLLPGDLYIYSPGLPVVILSGSADYRADRLHFADPSSFTRFFLRLKGVTPKAVRAANIK